MMENFKISLNANFEDLARIAPTNDWHYFEKIIGNIGICDFSNAFQISFNLYDQLNNSNSKNIYLLDIIIGTILSSCNQHSIALDYYEKGMEGIKDLNKWMYLYAKIWRFYSLSEMGYYNNKEDFEKLIFELKKQNLKSLQSLACLFLLFNYKKNKLSYTMDELDNIISDIDPSYPSLLLQALVIAKKDLPSSISLKGVIGKVEILDVIDSKHLNEYIQSKNNFLQKIDNMIYDSIDIEGNCSSCMELNCYGPCCYDGAYIDEAEKKVIEDFIIEYPKYFKENEDYFEIGNWNDTITGLKTKTRKYQYSANDYPIHFEKSACIFQSDNGSCLLQRAATENGLHPWKIKPLTCWLFPLRGSKMGKLRTPLKVGEADPHYYDESYPGYISYLPCGKSINSSKNPWYLSYKQEIIYYFYIYQNKIFY